MIAFIFVLSILFFISCAFFLINGADLIVYKYGINFPRLYFIIKRKVKLLNCSDIKKISIDTKNKSLVIELKSGKTYNYNNSSYYKTDHLFPILKDAFNEYEHIEFVS